MSYGISETTPPGRKCRATTGNFKARKGFGLLLALLILAAAGCGRQDRYEITPPALQGAAPPAEWGRITEIPVPALTSSRISALAAWAADDYLVSLGQGAVYRVQGDFYQPLAWPGPNTVVGLVMARDGTVWGLDGAGRVCTLEGNTWELVATLEVTSNGYYGLVEDDQGRLVAYGSQGQLMRREDEGWVARPAGPSHYLRHGWAAAGQGTFLVGEQGTVFRLTETGPDSLTVLPEVYQSSIRIEGDGLGALVVSASYDGTWLFDGEAWQDITQDNWFPGAFWSDGQLIGLGTSPREIVRWDGAAWQPWADYPGNGYLGTVTSVPVGQGRLVALDYGATLSLFGQEALALSPPLGSARGVASFQGRTHLLLDGGSHFVAEAAGWRLLGQPLPQEDVPAGHPLVVDEDGLLLLVGGHSLAWWDGQNHETAAHPGVYWRSALPQADGSLCLSGSNAWGVVRHGRYTPFYELPYSWDPLVGALLDEQDTGWVADSIHLGRGSPEAVATELLMQGWRVRGLSRDAAGRVLVFGEGRVLRQDGATWDDITPRLPRTPVIRTLIPDGLGGLLGWDSNNGALVHHDQEGWTFQEIPEIDFSWSYTRLTANPDGTFLLTGPPHSVLQLERVVWP